MNKIVTKVTLYGTMFFNIYLQLYGTTLLANINIDKILSINIKNRESDENDFYSNRISFI